MEKVNPKNLFVGDIYSHDRSISDQCYIVTRHDKAEECVWCLRCDRNGNEKDSWQLRTTYHSQNTYLVRSVMSPKTLETSYVID